MLRDGAFVGVVAGSEAEADAAVARLRGAASWDERGLLPDEDDLDTFLRAGPHVDIGLLDEAGAAPAADGAGDLVRATYTRPFLVHGSIAPSCGSPGGAPTAPACRCGATARASTTCATRSRRPSVCPPTR